VSTGTSSGSSRTTAVRADHGRHRGDGGIAADRIAAGHQDGHALRQPERAADGVAGGDGNRDHGHDAAQQRRPQRHHGARADRRAKHHHRDFQQDPGAERDARAPARPRCPGGADRHAQQDREHQSFQIRLPDEPHLDRLQDRGNAGDRQAKQQSGQQAACVRDQKRGDQ
jgi:hypothetical protein